MNDLNENIDEFSSIQYADDTQFLHADTVNRLEAFISRTVETLRNVKQYFFRNGLMLNSKKIQCIFRSSRQILPLVPPNTTIHCDGDNIYPSTHVKNLGVYIDKSICSSMFISMN